MQLESDVLPVMVGRVPAEISAGKLSVSRTGLPPTKKAPVDSSKRKAHRRQGNVVARVDALVEVSAGNESAETAEMIRSPSRTFAQVGSLGTSAASQLPPGKFPAPPVAAVAVRRQPEEVRGRFSREVNTHPRA